MNFKHARYILTVAQEGSITAAAAKLFVTQPSLSEIVKKVEQDLGMPIFERGIRPLRLTYAGERYVEAIRNILLIEADLNNDFEMMKDENHGRLKLGINMQRSMSLLPQVLPVFIKKYPFVKIELLEKPAMMLEQLLEKGECDVAMITTVPRSSALEYTLFQSERVMLIASKETEFSKHHENGEEINLDDVGSENFIVLTPTHSMRVLQEQLFNRYGIRPNILLETDSVETGKRLAAHCGAFMICPDVYVINDDYLSQYAKHFYIQYGEEYARHCYYCRRKNTYFPQYMKAFFDMSRECINRSFS